MLPINEPQNWANITIQQCCTGTVKKVKGCKAYVSAVWRRSSICIQEEWLPCKAISIAGKSISGQFLWENSLKWLNSPCSNYVLTKSPSEVGFSMCLREQLEALPYHFLDKHDCRGVCSCRRGLEWILNSKNRMKIIYHENFCWKSFQEGIEEMFKIYTHT